ncbi:MAG: hypothetical protein WCF99_01385 [Chloroflexales bacterium]
MTDPAISQVASGSNIAQAAAGGTAAVNVIQIVLTSAEDAAKLATNLPFLNSITETAAERDELKRVLTSERERHWLKAYEELRAQLNAGYSSAVQTAVAALLEEIEDLLATSVELNHDLLGRIYRLVATAFLPYRSGGDVERCRHYLLQARRFSSGDDAVKCQVLDAILANATRGLSAALALLDGLTSDEAIRLRFSLYIEHDQIADCQRMIEQGEVQEAAATQDAAWARALAFYYATTGTIDRFESCVRVLTSDHPSADHFEAVGFARTRLAFRRLVEFCRAHRVIPDIHFILDLEPLVDQEARRRAVDSFAEASQLYELHACPQEATRTTASALRLCMDGMNLERQQALCDRLARLDPDHPLLLALVYCTSNTAGETVRDRLVHMLEQGNRDFDLSLYIARWLAEAGIPIQEIVDLLLQYQDRFMSDNVLRFKFQFLIFELLRQVGNETNLVAWLDQLTAPEGHEYLRPLCYIGYYLDRDNDALAAWLHQSQELAPEQPEVLATSIIAQQKLHDAAAALAVAQRLFAQLRTAQTAVWVIETLRDNEQWTDLTEFIQQLTDLPIAEPIIRAHRAYAWLGRSQALRALDDLEWLYHNDRARPHHLLSLAQLYQYLHRPDEAIIVFQTCIGRHPEIVDAYLLLTQMLLAEGRRSESFTVALLARQRFPDNPQVAANLYMHSFHTGREMHEEIRHVTQELIPGGRFEDAGFLQQYEINDALDMMRSRQQVMAEVQALYRQGRISLTMFCYRFHNPLFRAHMLGIAQRSWRYAGIGVQDYTTPLWPVDGRRAVVLDYSALLTLWSLFGEGFLDRLRAHLDEVWIPESLLRALHWEQTTLSQHGQPFIYEAQVAIRAIVTRNASKFVIHPRVDPPTGIDVIGDFTEATLCRELGVLYLDEYPQQEQSVQLSRIGLRTLADQLRRDGTIIREAYQALVEHARPTTAEEEPLREQLRPGIDLVVDLTTLRAIAQAQVLDAFCQYVGRIHISAPAWERLNAECDDHETNQRLLDELRTLRDVLRRGIDSAFVHVESLAPEQRLIGVLAEERRNQREAESEHDDAVLQLAFDHLDELLGLAHFQQLPIWTDDRFICRLALPDRQPAFVFGTDTFLEWLRSSEQMADDEAFDNYGRLLEWKYLGLPIHPGYLRWLSQQNIPAGSPLFSRACQVYRLSMLEAWEMRQDNDASNTDFVQHIFSRYNRGFVELLWGYYREQASIETVTTIFRQLDIRRENQHLEGREIMYLGDLLLDAVRFDTTSIVDAAEMLQAVKKFCAWLDEVMIHSGIVRDEVDESWCWLIRVILDISDVDHTEPEQHHIHLFLQRLLAMMPVHVLTYCINEDVGQRLVGIFGELLEAQVVFTFAPSNGERMSLQFPQAQWDHDFEQAVLKFLTNPAPEPVTAGIVTIRILNYKPGSMLLQFHETPTAVWETYHMLPDVERIRYLCALVGFENSDKRWRLGVWHIGHQKLVEKGIPTDTWQQLEPLLRSDEHGVWQPASIRARRYLLSHAEIARDYLVEAARLDISALLMMLPFIEPEVVQVWLEISGVGWSDEHGIRKAARMVTDRLAPDVQDIAHIREVLRSFIERFGFSVFPDALVYQDAVVASICERSDLQEQRELMRMLAEIGQSTPSLTLRANILVMLLKCQAIASTNGAYDNIVSASAQLIEQIALARGQAATLQAQLSNLERQLCEYLYTLWQRRETQHQDHVEADAYLAYIAAGWLLHHLGDSIREHTIVRLIEELQAQVRHEQLSNGTPPQPSGFFKPAWALELNYPISFVLDSVVSQDLIITPLLLHDVTRNVLIQCGAAQRIFQSFMDTAIVEPTWLDTCLARDVGIVIAALCATILPEESSVLSDTDVQGLLLCAAPEAGAAWCDGVLSRLDQGQDSEVLQVLQMVFLGLHTGGSRWLAYVERLLDPMPLRRIKQSPGCYQVLLWYLGELLLTTPLLDSNLAQRIRTLVFAQPTGESGEASLLEIQAETLAAWASFEKGIDDIAAWLRAVAQEDLPLSTVRSVARPFVRLWPGYPDTVQYQLTEAFLDFARSPKYSKLWEIFRLTRDWHQAAYENSDNASSE